eukprot:TRINITY_DN21580_c0_g1_i1.p2 TRINITY_DN21580_c0_g1~~TRINITY_DN21580_c0_g1_i1.p2  ORF type:complete len:106 (-),score=17.42 TRINITY_DN21580_c0_g1_i1:28-345(-)
MASHRLVSTTTTSKRQYINSKLDNRQGKICFFEALTAAQVIAARELASFNIGCQLDNEHDFVGKPSGNQKSQFGPFFNTATSQTAYKQEPTKEACESDANHRNIC